MEFIEERLDTCIQLGAASDDSYAVDAVTTASGSRYARLINGLPYREFDISYIKTGTELALSVRSLYDRTYGGFAGFRVKSWDDFTTANDGVSAYTALDCVLPLVSAGVYQLVKEYGRDKPALASIGRPKRTLYKPITGKVAFGVAGVAYPAAQWSVDTTTGKITCAANKSRAITGISKASQAVVTIGSHTFVVGNSVAFAAVAGMTEINGLRALVVATTGTTITVAINSTAFTAWASGGTVQTQPITGEVITGGCEFDLPCVFNGRLSVDALDYKNRSISGLNVIEVLNI